MGLLAYRIRSVIKGFYTRIQAPNSGALQVLLTAAKGDRAKRKEGWTSAELSRCFSSVPAVRDYACCNSL